MKLGIIGAPRAGKDTIASYLVENKGFLRLAFADQIKNEYYKISGFTEYDFKKRNEKEDEIRNGLWEYSKKAMEQNGQYYFIDQVLEKVKNNTIITDVRTLNEVFECKKSKIKLFIIIRNVKKELNGYYLLGTKIPLFSIMGTYPIFWNDSNNLNITYQRFEEFLGGKIMDPDSNSK